VKIINAWRTPSRGLISTKKNKDNNKKVIQCINMRIPTCKITKVSNNTNSKKRLLIKYKKNKVTHNDKNKLSTYITKVIHAWLKNRKIISMDNLRPLGRCLLRNSHMTK
jgi:hypothetical protein